MDGRTDGRTGRSKFISSLCSRVIPNWTSRMIKWGCSINSFWPLGFWPLGIQKMTKCTSMSSSRYVPVSELRRVLTWKDVAVLIIIQIPCNQIWSSLAWMKVFFLLLDFRKEQQKMWFLEKERKKERQRERKKERKNMQSFFFLIRGLGVTWPTGRTDKLIFWCPGWLRSHVLVCFEWLLLIFHGLGVTRSIAY